jgi:hypothetical protein
MTPKRIGHYKDQILDMLGRKANVAQFVSFSPDERQRFSRVFRHPPNVVFASLEEGIHAVMQNSTEQSVNVRSFDPASPKSREFVYGLKSINDAASAVRRLASKGLHTIVNETIDVCDGGVSGVVIGDVMEFAPCDTPRCVEKPGTVSIDRAIGLRLLENVYGFVPALEYGADTRVEFSVHPIRRGVRNEHTIVWELERVGGIVPDALPSWPNRFSKYIGDKAFGLLIANLLGLPVPRTTVVSRHIAPFTFGKSTGTEEYWIRTCPVVQMPGKFTTRRGWMDPFQLLQQEDPDGNAIASVLAQEGVRASYSGAVLASKGDDGAIELVIEGTVGFGDEFMVGRKARTQLPSDVVDRVRRLHKRASRLIGPVRMEWVTSGDRIWVVQFHRGLSVSFGRTIVPGKPSRYRRFEVSRGLEELRVLTHEVGESGEGIVLVGNVGITSHFGDVLRRARVPSMLEPD